MTVTVYADIPVSGIDLSDTRYRITGPWRDCDMENLSASIARHGIMTAPLVLSRADRYIVVSGFRRIEAARHAGVSRITCRVMPPDEGQAHLDAAAHIDTSDTIAAAVAAVAENSFSRELTPAELIRSTALLLRFMDAESIAEHAVSIFNRPLNSRYIKTLARIHAMPDPVCELLDHGRLSIRACKALVPMDTATIAGFLHLFSIIKVSSGIQIEIITWAKEICALERISLATLVQESPLGDSCHVRRSPAGMGIDMADSGHGGHRDMSALGRQFKAFLSRRRFPALTAARNRAMEQIRALGLDSGLQLTMPENFEGVVYTMQMAFKNMDGFNTHLARLAALSDHHDFNTLVDR